MLSNTFRSLFPLLLSGTALSVALTAVLTLSACAVHAQKLTIAAAGDIACSPQSDKHYNGGMGTPENCQMKATSDLILARDVDAVLTLGDNQYSTGRLGAYEASFGATWGRFKNLIYPVPGNHEYFTTPGAGYYAYFGDAARDPTKGYYSFDLSSWHLIALNSNCDSVGGCGEGSEQLEWLKADLAANASACTLAFWHHPRFSSGRHGNNPKYQAFWEQLYAAGAELVLGGHDHHYERFAPQTPQAELDAERGLRAFVVGTGGKSLYSAQKRAVNSEVVGVGTFGVLFLTLGPGQYSWLFESAAGADFTDRGSGSCH